MRTHLTHALTHTQSYFSCWTTCQRQISEYHNETICKEDRKSDSNQDSYIILQKLYPNYQHVIDQYPTLRVYKGWQGYLNRQNQLKPKVGQLNTQAQSAIYNIANITQDITFYVQFPDTTIPHQTISYFEVSLCKLAVKITTPHPRGFTLFQLKIIQIINSRIGLGLA